MYEKLTYYQNWYKGLCNKKFLKLGFRKPKQNGESQSLKYANGGKNEGNLKDLIFCTFSFKPYNLFFWFEKER